MKTLLAALLFLGLAARSEQSGPGIEAVRALVESVESDLRSVVEQAYSAQTECSVIDENINNINDFFLAKIKVTNEQQFELIDDFSQQIKALRHRVDADEARTLQAATLADRTSKSLYEIYQETFYGIKIRDEEQEGTISNLRDLASNQKGQFLTALNQTINGLRSNEESNWNKIRALGEYVDEGRCEYGLVYIPIGESRRIYFKTAFDYPPEMSVAMPGFVAHLDGYLGEQYDILDFAKHLGEVTSSYFMVNTDNNSQGQVKAKYLQCSWMACQGLNSDLVL